MRLLRNVIVGLVGLAAVLVIVAYVLPREITVERTVRIEAAPDAIFPHINALKATEAWSPWIGRDPNIQIAYEGPEAGAGNRMSWTSEVRDVGSGSQEIVVSVPDERVETDLDFGAMGTARAWFALEPQGEATAVTWGLRTDMGLNPVARWMGLMMDRWVGADYETGLGNLKALVEGG